MKTAELKVQPRTAEHKSENKHLRAQGYVPANIYGPKVSNAFCAFDERDLFKLFKAHSSRNIIISLKSDAEHLEGKKVILKSLERDPVSWKPVHADFYQIDLSRPISVNVSLEFKGTPVGVKIGGGILQIIRRSIGIKALPEQVPESIEVNIEALELGDSLHVEDIKTPENVQITDELDYTVASIIEAEAEEEVPTTAAVPAEGEGSAAASATTAADSKAEKPAEDKKS